MLILGSNCSTTYCSTLNLNFEFWLMVGPEPPDLPPCPDLQLVLVVCRDLEDKSDDCGTIGVNGKDFSDTIALDSGGPIGFPLEGG